MTRRALAAHAAALCLLSACAPAPETGTPSETPSAASSAAVASVDIASLRTSDGGALPADDATKINCTVDGRGDARWTATFADATKAQVDVQLPPQASGRAVWQGVPFGNGWVMAIVPGDVEELDVIADVPANGGFYSVEAGPLAAIQSTCLAIRFDSAADATKVQGLVWRGLGGPFLTDTGATVPSVDVAVENDRLSVYSDATLDVFGILTASGSAISYRPTRSGDPFPCVLFSTGAQENGRWRTFFVGVLPAGSTNVKLTFLPAVSQPSFQTAIAATGEVFVVAEARTHAQTGEIFSSIAYTDGNGSVVRPTWR